MLRPSEGRLFIYVIKALLGTPKKLTGFDRNFSLNRITQNINSIPMPPQWGIKPATEANIWFTSGHLVKDNEKPYNELWGESYYLEF